MAANEDSYEKTLFRLQIHCPKSSVGGRIKSHVARIPETVKDLNLCIMGKFIHLM